MNALKNKKTIKKLKFRQSKKTKKRLNLQNIIDSIYKKLKGKYQDAKNAEYIPILKDMDPNIFQISVYPVKNNSYGFLNKQHSVGDFFDKNGEPIEVSIQSVSKVFNLAKAIKVRNNKNRKNKKIKNKTGLDDILELIGTEESFMGFNDIKAHQMLNGSQGIPFTINPFINAGAIATVSFITPNKKNNKSTFSQIIDNMNKFSGHNRKRQYVSVSIYENEMKWLETNNKLAKKIKSLSEKYYHKKKNIRKFKYFQGNDDTLDIKSSLSNYTSACSILVDTKELVDMTYTLANGGVNSKNEKILNCKENRYILSSMIFSGMYNASGQLYQKLGIPMKSGVGGAIIGIIPGEMAISVISPPLDEYGNSFLGGQVFLHLINALNFHSNGKCKGNTIDIPLKPRKVRKIKHVNLKRENKLNVLEDLIEKGKETIE